MTSIFAHETVLLDEAVAALNIVPDGVYVDGTYGRGGHSAKILQSLAANGRLLVIDKDPVAVADAKQKYTGDERVWVWHGSFSEFDIALSEFGCTRKIQGMLMDLGVSSPQLDDAARGFSFQKSGELDMRMNPEQGLSAKQWLMHASETEIANVLWRYGEERFSYRIARNILRHRANGSIETTMQLADIIAQAVPKREPGKHPATRSFQAIRIHVNQELSDVETCLHKLLNHLASAGRVVVISFHSLEDRLVKHFLRDASQPPAIPRGLPVMDDLTIKPPLQLVGKAVRASETELERNVRSRSAIMRIAERN